MPFTEKCQRWGLVQKPRDALTENRFHLGWYDSSYKILILLQYDYFLTFGISLVILTLVMRFLQNILFILTIWSFGGQLQAAIKAFDSTETVDIFHLDVSQSKISIHRIVQQTNNSVTIQNSHNFFYAIVPTFTTLAPNFLFTMSPLSIRFLTHSKSFLFTFSGLSPPTSLSYS